MQSLVRVLAVTLIAGGVAGAATQEADGGSRRLTIDDRRSLSWVGDPRFSPDGQAMAYGVQASGAATLYVSARAGGPARRLSGSPQLATDPRWRSDERALAYRGRTNERWQPWLAELDGQEPHPLTLFPEGVRDFAWSPDGTRLVVAATGQALENTLLSFDVTDESLADVLNRLSPLLGRPFVLDEGIREPVTLRVDGGSRSTCECATSICEPRSTSSPRSAGWTSTSIRTFEERCPSGSTADRGTSPWP